MSDTFKFGGNEIVGLRELKKKLEEVDKVSIKVVTTAARAGAKIVRTDARTNAPVDTGNLKRGIKYKLEKRKPGKRVYDIGFYGAEGKGEEFVKVGKNGKRSFYPVSQEYGWVDQNGKRHEGKRFLRNALNMNRSQIQNLIAKTMMEALNKL